MIRVLRGIVQVGGQPEIEEGQANWLKLQEHSLGFENEEDHRIHQYLQTFFSQMGVPPDFKLVREYFEKLDDVEAVTRLDEASKAPLYIRTNYLSIVRAEMDRQQVKALVLLCRDTGAIAEQGRNVDKPINGKKVLRGVQDAVNYMFENLSSFTQVESGEKLEGVVSEDAEEIIDEYEHIESTNQFANRNLFGLEPVDSVCKGHRIGEYWIHTGFVGELKSTIALNYAYNNVMVYGKNIFYCILEMPYKQLRRQLFAIHSSHGKFVTQWHGEDGYTGLDYRQIRDGELDKRGKERFKIVARDFMEAAGGRLYVWRPSSEVSIKDIQRKAEMFHNRWGCDGIVIDHLGLVRPSEKNRDYVVALNSVVREGRIMALNFARGRAVPVLALFQMNRQGKMRADKNDGRYDISAISYANECVVKGTIVTTRRGLIPIESVEPGHDEVWSMSGWKRVLNRFNNGKRSVFEIKDARGFSVIATRDHRLRTLSDGVVTWTSVQDLKEGDFLLSGFGRREFPPEAPQLPKLESRKWERLRNHKGDTLTVPNTMTSDLAYLMGAHLGDGIFKKKSSIIGWCGNRKEETLRIRLQTAAASVFDQEFTLVQSPSRESVFDLTKNSKSLTRWFDTIGLNRRPGIPEVILRSPDWAVCSYLRGLWDTDGSINVQGILSVGLKETHFITLQQVQMLLTGLGIDSSLSHKVQSLNGKSFGAWTIRIRSRASREKFEELIGFTEPRKMEKLGAHVRSKASSRKFGDGTSWPIGSVFRRVCDRYRYLGLSRKVTHAYKNCQLIPHGALLSLIDSLPKTISDSDVSHLHLLAERCRPSELKSILPIGEATVYDLEVTGDHEYEASGLLSHNCEKSADVVTYTYLNDQLRAGGKFYLGNLKNRDNPLFEQMIGKILWQSKRIRAIESGLLDLDNDQVIEAAKRISRGMDMSDLLAS